MKRLDAMRYSYDHDMDLARRFTGEWARNLDEMAFAILLGAQVAQTTSIISSFFFFFKATGDIAYT